MFSDGVNRGSKFMFSMKMIEQQKKQKPVDLQRIQEEEFEESLSKSARSLSIDSIDDSHTAFDKNNLSII